MSWSHPNHCWPYFQAKEPVIESSILWTGQIHTANCLKWNRTLGDSDWPSQCPKRRHKQWNWTFWWVADFDFPLNQQIKIKK
jgi:hypothetical protein